MLQTLKVNKDVVAVSNAPTEILLRQSGRAYFGTEKVLCRIKDGKLMVNGDVAKQFGLTVEFTSTIWKEV